jgi:hypothetical protein
MKKYLLLWIVFFSTGVFASTPVERLLLINDFEGWLNNNKSHFNWGDFREKEVRAFSDIKQPAHIYRDFKSNSIAAEDKYNKSFQRFYGHISGIEKNNRGEPLVVFDVAYFNKIYVNGLTKNEVVKLRVPNRVDLLCVGFRMDSFDDISTTCSMFDSAQRMIAVNIIQLLDKQNKLNLPHKNKKEIDKLITLISNELDPKFNQECEVIDSLNYSSCLSLMDEAMGRMEKKKAP